MTSYSTVTTKKVAEHTFLMAGGRWNLKGHWLLEREGPLLPIHGKLMVVWNGEEWFNLVGKISLPSSLSDSNANYPSEVTLQYRGHIGAEQQYTFVLQHNHLGHIEGEGWLMPDSILQRFWIIGDRERRTGVDQIYRIDNDHYHWSSSIMTGHALNSAMDVTLERFR
jgi:hypothetical protein